MKPSEFYSSINLCLNTRCNICKETCPRFNIEKVEFNSPRGKLELITEAIEGKIGKEEVRKELSCSRECRECSSSCPHGINITNIFIEFIDLKKEM
jgi:glycolate oxidase iron-sulfur subunit